MNALPILIMGGSIGFYISQRYFPKFDFGYKKEGGNKIVTRIKNQSNQKLLNAKKP